MSWLIGAGSTGYQGLLCGGVAVTSHARTVSDDGKVLAGMSESATARREPVRWLNQVAESHGSEHDVLSATALGNDGKVVGILGVARAANQAGDVIVGSSGGAKRLGTRRMACACFQTCR